jgi:DNA-binding NtrC family response regulator
MAYNVLIIENNARELTEKYRRIMDEDAVRRRIQCDLRMLQLRGHHVFAVTELDQITEELYQGQDCVLLHPSIDKLKRVSELHRNYPHVGLILVTGDAKNSVESGSLARDGDGFYFIVKPYKYDVLSAAIDRVVGESASIAQNPEH